MKYIRYIEQNAHQGRIEWLDGLKGVGILLVLLCHAGLLSTRIGALLTAGYMSLFFIAAGFTYKRADGFKMEVFKRSKRLLLPYFFYGVGTIVFLSLTFLLLNQEYDVISAVKGLFYSRYSIVSEPMEYSEYMLKHLKNSPMWFLTSLFTSMLAIYILDKYGYKFLFIYLFIYLLASVFLSFLPILLPWSLDTAFVGAILIWYGRHRITTCHSMLSLMITLILYVLLVYLEKTNNISIREYGIHGAWSIVLYIIIGIFEYNILVYFLKAIEGSAFSKVISRIGRMSLMLLCTHAPIYVLTENINDYFHVIQAADNSMLGCAKVILALSVALILYMIVSKSNVKIVRILFGL